MPGLRLGRRTLSSVVLFDPRGTLLAVGRSLLAAAQLSVLLFTPDAGLFLPTAQAPEGVRCGGVRGLFPWCLVPDPAGGHDVARIAAVAVLATVAAGWRPRWTCIPHWYITAGLAAGMTLPNGGERIAMIITLLLIPICLGDGRRWQWRPPAEPLPPTWRGSAWASVMVLRIQVMIVYAHGVLSKVSLPEWRNGDALYYALHDAYYGPMPPLRTALAVFSTDSAALTLLCWGVIAAEAAICLCMLTRHGPRRVGLPLAIALHGGIAVVLGLVSFGLVMIGTLAVSAAGTRQTP